MNKIDYSKEKIAFNNGTTKWYVHKQYQKYIENEQADNLPKLKGYGCFVVIGNNIEDLVLIDNKQNILGSYNNNAEGQDQMKCKINIIKIAKHYEEYEEYNI